MSHASKMLLLKAATALALIGLITLVVLWRGPALRAAIEQPPVAPEPNEPVRVAPPPAAEAVPQALAPAPAEDPEEQVRQQIEQLLDRDPAAALALLSEADAKFPRGRQADERVFLRLKAMVNLDQVADARVLATEYLELNPQSPLGRRIHRLLGIHPPPALPSR